MLFMRGHRPDTSKESVGRRIAAIRKARGMDTAVALARLFDISPQRQQGYERGRVYPPPEYLARLWQLTGATSDYILFGRIDSLPFELAERLREADVADPKADRA